MHYAFILAGLATLVAAAPLKMADDGKYVSYKPYASYVPYSSAVDEMAKKMQNGKPTR
jgi:hypothetical protein